MGIDELPVDGVLRRFAEDREATWIAFNELVQRVVVGVARRANLQFADIEDLRDVVMLRLVVDDFAALRRGDSTTRCAAWIGGVARNVLREQRRRDRRDRTMRELRTADRRGQRVPDDSPRNRLELEALTATQRAVVGCILDGASERQTAAILGMSRNRVHDIKRRALSSLRRGHERNDAPDRRWARAVLERRVGRRDDLTVRILSMYIDGKSQREIAAKLGVSVSSVRGRVHRARASAVADSN